MKASANRRSARAAVLRAAEGERRAGRPVALNSLAHLAGVGVGTVYRHFPSPAAVVEALVLHRFTELEEMASRARRSDGGARVPDFFAAAVDVVLAVPDLGDVALRAECALEETAAAKRRLVSSVSALLEDSRERGDFRCALEPAEVLALVCGTARTARDLGVDGARARGYVTALLRGLQEHTPAT